MFDFELTLPNTLINKQDFCKYIRNILLNLVLSKSNNQRVQLAQQYLKDNYIDIDLKQLYIDTITNMKIIILKNNNNSDIAKFKFDKNIKTNNFTDYQILRFLEFGSLEIQKCPILSNSIQYILDNIQTLYMAFRLGV